MFGSFGGPLLCLPAWRRCLSLCFRLSAFVMAVFASFSVSLAFVSFLPPALLAFYGFMGFWSFLFTTHFASPFSYLSPSPVVGTHPSIDMSSVVMSLLVPLFASCGLGWRIWVLIGSGWDAGSHVFFGPKYYCLFIVTCLLYGLPVDVVSHDNHVLCWLC